MNDFITFITANWPTLIGIITALVGVFALIAKLTPTPKDDGIAAAIMKFLNLLPGGVSEASKKEADKDEPTPLL